MGWMKATRSIKNVAFLDKDEYIIIVSLMQK
jgi:hypothetical protein